MATEKEISKLIVVSKALGSKPSELHVNALKQLYKRQRKLKRKQSNGKETKRLERGE